MQFTKELKENWLTALKSGKYQKGTGMLRHNETNTFCCLGVLCEISPDLSISKSENGILENGHMYAYIIDAIGDEVINILIDTNDSSPNDNFEGVIPIIGKIPTVD